MDVRLDLELVCPTGMTITEFRKAVLERSGAIELSISEVMSRGGLIVKNGSPRVSEVTVRPVETRRLRAIAADGYPDDY